MKKTMTFHWKKIWMVFLVCALMLLGLVGRLVYLMGVRSDYYYQKAEELHERERVIKAARGQILDAKGRVLADNKTVCTISVIHSQIKEPQKVIEILSKELGIDTDTVRKKVEKISSIERIKTNVEKSVGDVIRGYELDGVKVDEDYKRYYPYGSLASKVLGFTGGDNQGIIGLEVKYEEVLKGQAGKILTTTDARGVEIPYVDRDGKELTTVLERYMPAPGQKFFLKGGVIDDPKYEYRGPETLPFEELMKRGYKLPFYADLSRMPEEERRVIWGVMVGEEGKTKIPILKNYTERGFDPTKHMLQSYGTGWQSAAFLDQERQLFGAPGGIITDWDLKTNIDGIYAAGDQLYASDCCGYACATGYYAGRKAAAAADTVEYGEIDREFCEKEKERLYHPLYVENGMDWRELNMAISKAMQNYCGGTKCKDLLTEGLDLLAQYERDVVPNIQASNPHELMRAHEVFDILEVARLILNACLLRESSSAPLCFLRSDFPEMDPAKDDHFITIRLDENGKVVKGEIPKGYFGDLETEYEKRNQDYIRDGK